MNKPVVGTGGIFGVTGIGGTPPEKQCIYSDHRLKGCYFKNTELDYANTAILVERLKNKDPKTTVGIIDELFNRDKSPSPYLQCTLDNHNYYPPTSKAERKEATEDINGVASCPISDTILYVNSKCPLVLAIAKKRLETE